MLSNIVQKGGKKIPRRSSVIGLGLLFLICSCTTANYGKLQPNPEITKIFDDNRILSDHSYYYSGLQGVPDAIVGIQSNYSLKSKMWQPVDLTSQMLEKWVSRMTYVIRKTHFFSI